MYETDIPFVVDVKLFEGLSDVTEPLVGAKVAPTYVSVNVAAAVGAATMVTICPFVGEAGNVTVNVVPPVYCLIITDVLSVIVTVLVPTGKTTIA